MTKQNCIMEFYVLSNFLVTKVITIIIIISIIILKYLQMLDISIGLEKVITRCNFLPDTLIKIDDQTFFPL